MKKKIEKRKLVLAKETVAKLEGDLSHVAGGTIANTACDGCFSGANTCNCTGSRNTCGTRLC